MSRFSSQKNPCEWEGKGRKDKWCSNEARVTDRKTGKRYCEFHAFLIMEDDLIDDAETEAGFKKAEKFRREAEIKDKQAELKALRKDPKKKTVKKKPNPLAGEF